MRDLNVIAEISVKQKLRMKTKSIVAEKAETAVSENHEWMSLTVSDGNEQIEVVFETTMAPVLAASIISSSQIAAKEIAPKKLTEDLAKHLERSLQMLPEAVDIKLVADGEVLCINVGSGALFFRLSEPAKRALNEPIDQGSTTGGIH